MSFLCKTGHPKAAATAMCNKTEDQANVLDACGREVMRFDSQ
jgi:hypothetical protein